MKVGRTFGLADLNNVSSMCKWCLPSGGKVDGLVLSSETG